MSIRGYIIYQKACGLQLYVHFGNHLLYGYRAAMGLPNALCLRSTGAGAHTDYAVLTMKHQVHALRQIVGCLRGHFKAKVYKLAVF